MRLVNGYKSVRFEASDLPSKDVAELVDCEAVVLASGEVDDELSVERIDFALVAQREMRTTGWISERITCVSSYLLAHA